jgi:hypothetical protein
VSAVQPALSIELCRETQRWFCPAGVVVDELEVLDKFAQVAVSTAGIMVEEDILRLGMQLDSRYKLVPAEASKATCELLGIDTAAGKPEPSPNQARTRGILRYSKVRCKVRSGLRHGRRHYFHDSGACRMLHVCVAS